MVSRKVFTYFLWFVSKRRLLSGLIVSVFLFSLSLPFLFTSDRDSKLYSASYFMYSRELTAEEKNGIKSDLADDTFLSKVNSFVELDFEDIHSETETIKKPFFTQNNTTFHLNKRDYQSLIFVEYTAGTNEECLSMSYCFEYVFKKHYSDLIHYQFSPTVLDNFGRVYSKSKIDNALFYAGVPLLVIIDSAIALVLVIDYKDKKNAVWGYFSL